MNIFGINFTATDIFLLSACGTLFIVLIGLTYKSEIRRRDIFNKASKEFVDTVHCELKGIYPNPINWPENIDYYLRDRFDNLHEAVGKFERHLPSLKRKRFIKAWFRFYNATGREIDNKNCQCYLHYIPSSGEGTDGNGEYTFHDNTKTYKQDFRDNVDALLKYAKLK